MKIMDNAQYREEMEPVFEQTSFFEQEVKRRIDILGNMAHAWSLYEARTNPDDAEPERRGVNSIQLYKDAKGEWRIISMIWDNERPGVAVEPF